MFSGVDSIGAIPLSSALPLHGQSRVPSLEPGSVVPYPQTVLWTPPTPGPARCDFVSLYAPVDAPRTSLCRVSGTGLAIFRCMPPLLPREIVQTASVVLVWTLRPSPSDQWVGISAVK